MDLERQLAASIIVPCRNEIGHIETCLKSILSQDPPAGGFEIVVADGRSADGTREFLDRMAREHPQIRVIDNPDLITSTALNAAIRAARADIIIRMDAHTTYAPNYVRECLAVLEETGADNVGGPWIAKGYDYTSGAIAAAFQSYFAVGTARGHHESYTGPIDTVYLGCWRRAAFDKFGFFDEALVHNQDDEHNLRIIRGEGKIWLSSRIKSRYSPRGSLRALFLQYMRYGYWKVSVIRKHGRPGSLRHLVPGVFMFSLLMLGSISLVCAVSRGHWPFASFLWLPALLLDVAFAGSYGLFLGAASLITAAKSGWKFLPVLPFVFATYHFGYGWGFLLGLRDLALGRRKIGDS